MLPWQSPARPASLRCSKTKAVFAHVVPCKGVDEDEYVSSIVVKDLEWVGHMAMILKADRG